MSVGFSMFIRTPFVFRNVWKVRVIITGLFRDYTYQYIINEIGIVRNNSPNMIGINSITELLLLLSKGLRPKTNLPYGHIIT